MTVVMAVADPVSIGAGSALAVLGAAVVAWMAKSIRNAAPFSFRIVDRDAATTIDKLRGELSASLAREAELKTENAVLRYQLRERGGRHPEGE